MSKGDNPTNLCVVMRRTKGMKHWSCGDQMQDSKMETRCSYDVLRIFSWYWCQTLTVPRCHLFLVTSNQVGFSSNGWFLFMGDVACVKTKSFNATGPLNRDNPFNYHPVLKVNRPVSCPVPHPAVESGSENYRDPLLKKVRILETVPGRGVDPTYDTWYLGTHCVLQPFTQISTPRC